MRGTTRTLFFSSLSPRSAPSLARQTQRTQIPELGHPAPLAQRPGQGRQGPPLGGRRIVDRSGGRARRPARAGGGGGGGRGGRVPAAAPAPPAPALLGRGGGRAGADVQGDVPALRPKGGAGAGRFNGGQSRALSAQGRRRTVKPGRRVGGGAPAGPGLAPGAPGPEVFLLGAQRAGAEMPQGEAPAGGWAGGRHRRGQKLAASRVRVWAGKQDRLFSLTRPNKPRAPAVRTFCVGTKRSQHHAVDRRLPAQRRHRPGGRRRPPRRPAPSCAAGPARPPDLCRRPPPPGRPAGDGPPRHGGG